MIKPLRGEVWEVDFDPSIGQEIKKPRPAVVMSLDSIALLELRIVVPIRHWKKTFSDCPWIVALDPTSTNGLTKKSGADCFQVKSVSKGRILRHLGHLTDAQVEEIADGILLCVA